MKKKKMILMYPSRNRVFKRVIKIGGTELQGMRRQKITRDVIFSGVIINNQPIFFRDLLPRDEVEVFYRYVVSYLVCCSLTRNLWR